MILWGWVNHTR